MFRIVCSILFVFTCSVSTYGADITVTAKSENSGKQAVSLHALRQDGSSASETFVSVLTRDLSRSGWFIPVTSKSAGVNVSGNVRANGSMLSVQTTCSWLLGGRQANWSITVPGDQIRDAAHTLCDFIVEKVTGKKGMAASRILMVGRRNGTATDIYVCDADGARLQQITADGKLCMSPNWMYNHNAFLYTSWFSGTPAVYKVDLKSRRRELLTSYPGMNHGAVAHPHENVMAIILSRSGGVDMYIQNMTTRKLTRITSSKSINEASPAWSPDGKNLVYVNDEGRIPRVYIMDVISKQGRRAFYASGIRESVAPEWGPSNQITFCGRSGGRYQIYIVDPDADPRITPPTRISPEDGVDYEDPSWAPDGRHIVCTRTVNFKRSLVILDTMGDVMKPLFNVSGDWYLPNWSRTNFPIR